MTVKTRKNGQKYAHLQGEKGRVRISLGTRSAKEAKQLAKDLNLEKLEHAAKAGTLRGEVVSRLVHGRRVTLRSFLKQWADAAQYRNESPYTTFRNSSTVETWFKTAEVGDIAPTNLTPAHLYDYINADDTRTASTRTRQLSAIRTFLIFVNTATHALDPAILSVRVASRKLSQEQREPKTIRAFTAVEQDSILTHLENAFKEDPADQGAAFWFFASHFSRAGALRLGDVAQLEWFSLGKPGHLIVWSDKRNTRVCLPISEKITPGLKRVIPLLPMDIAGPGRYVFPSMAERYNDISKRDWFSVTFSRILRRIGVEGSFHWWRHTAITRWKAEGFDLDQCAELAGHTDTKSTRGYIHE